MQVAIKNINKWANIEITSLPGWQWTTFTIICHHQMSVVETHINTCVIFLKCLPWLTGRWKICCRIDKGLMKLLRCENYVVECWTLPMDGTNFKGCSTQKKYRIRQISYDANFLVCPTIMRRFILVLFCVKLKWRPKPARQQRTHVMPKKTDRNFSPTVPVSPSTST